MKRSLPCVEPLRHACHCKILIFFPSQIVLKALYKMHAVIFRKDHAQENQQLTSAIIDQGSFFPERNKRGSLGSRHLKIAILSCQAQTEAFKHSCHTRCAVNLLLGLWKCIALKKHFPQLSKQFFTFTKSVKQMYVSFPM